MPIALLALAIGAFGLGTSETIVMGLLPQLSGSLHVTIADAGLLVSGYAFGVTISSPIVAILTNSLTRHKTLLLTISLFTLGNLLSCLAPGYWSLMAGRIVTSFAHGTFYGAASVIACQIVPPNKRAQALSLVYIGLTLAMIVGVPLGTAIAQFFGSWRVAFMAIVVIGIIAFLTISLWVPKDKISGPPVHIYAQLRAVAQPLVVSTMLISMCTSASMFCLFTYISPFLHIRTGLSSHAIDLVLLMIGGGLCIGNVLGGWLADWKMLPSCAGIMFLVAVMQLLLVPASLNVWTCLPVLFIWGVLIYAPMAPLQTYVVQCAQSAPNIVSAMNQSSFNFGNAVGAWAGSLFATGYAGYDRLPYLSAGFAMTGFVFVFVAMHYARKAGQRIA